MSYAGQTVLVTGGAGAGCGSAFAQHFASKGANIVLIDKAEVRLREVESQLKTQFGGSVMAFAIDLTDLVAVKKAVEEVHDIFGPIDILINNAATNKPMSFDEYEPAHFRRIVDVDFTACWYIAKLVFSSMRESRKGIIINISSCAPYTGGGVEELPYSAAKAALHELTRAIAVAGGPFNIRCNAVVLGVVRTNFVQTHWETLGLGDVVTQTPLGRLCELQEVMSSVDFLCSPASSFITGEILNVSGGLHLTA